MDPNALTRAQVERFASTFVWNKQLPRWTVIVNGREFPVRPLVLGAAHVLPNDKTNSHRAVAILKNLGFEVRYDGRRA